MLKLYDFIDSGNSYKVQLLLHFLGIPFDLVEVDIMAGETRTEDFLKKNPNGRIPLLELEDGSLLAESNAILFYLAEGTDFLPDDRLGRAKALQWMFFEQYSHEPYVAVLRFWKKHQGKSAENEPQWAGRAQQGYAALDVMERELAGQDWLLGARPTIADIALYAYTHVAHEGDYDLSNYPALVAWMERMRQLPGYVRLGQR